MRTLILLLLLTSLAFFGCADSSYTPPNQPASQVMSEQDRRQVVDHMVGQGANRGDAEAFTKALNDAQREWEAKNR